MTGLIRAITEPLERARADAISNACDWLLGETLTAISLVAVADNSQEFDAGGGAGELDGEWLKDGRGKTRGKPSRSAWRVELLATERAVLLELLDRLRRDFGTFEADISTMPERDWVKVSQQGLKPLTAGRFFIHGRHDRALRRAGGVNIEIDAGQAFGSGHHGTTLGCLRALDAILKQHRPRSCLDLGTGSGVLAIAFARAVKRPSLASDIDPIATHTARTNARRNEVAPHIRAITAAGARHAAIEASAPYDLITANILAGPLARMAPDIARLAASNGRIILSGLLPRQMPRLAARLRQHGILPDGKITLEGWVTGIFKK